MADAATIEQMNKVRASLGLALLPVPGQTQGGPQSKAADDSESDEDQTSTLDKRQAAASDNWQKLENERLDKIDRQKRKDAAKKARDAAARFAKLDGKGLGEADDAADLDTRSWLLQQKKRQKKIEQARKLEAELADREREMQAAYSSKDLAGVRVGHEIEEFDEMTGEKILTLKDTQIGEESEDDELENQELRDQEKLQERLNLKKKRPDYDPTEHGDESAVLSKYDEEINGPKQKRFKLDNQGTSSQAKQQRVAREQKPQPGRVKISLDMLEDDAPITDYLEPTTVKVKKPKKKKEKKTRQKAADDDDLFPVQPTTASNGDAMDIDTANVSKKRALEFDDDDLQSKLAQQRREALKNRKKTDAVELARQMREEMVVDEDEVEEGGLLIDETSEFVANLQRPETPDKDEEKDQEPAATNLPSNGHDDDGDLEMGEDAHASLDNAEVPNIDGSLGNGLEAEESMAGRGLGGTIALLRRRGLVKDGDSTSIAEKERSRQRFLNEKQQLIDDFDRRAKEQREADRKSGHFDKMTNRERDEYNKQQNEYRERYLARLQADMFNADYKPEVKLEYYDEYGRSMNQKEAFKHLSHSFHGKTSGKGKTEKRLKKIADEQKRMSKGVLNADESSGMSYVQGREGKRTKQAGVRLQ